MVTSDSPVTSKSQLDYTLIVFFGEQYPHSKNTEGQSYSLLGYRFFIFCHFLGDFFLALSYGIRWEEEGTVVVIVM